MSDQIVKLLFAKKNVRGVILHADAMWNSLLSHRKLPNPVVRLLGEMSAGALLLASGLKFRGSLILQLQGDGPVRLAIVEVRDGLTVRATVKLRVDEKDIPEESTFKTLVNINGKGRCALILDAYDRQAGTQPYQGIVNLESDSVASSLEAYMTQSEQLKTKLWLAGTRDAIGGVLLQVVPKTGGNMDATENAEQGFESVELFAKTVQDRELLELDADIIARRLFWEDNPRVLATQVPRFQCRCSIEGIRAMVRNLGLEESRKIVEERGTIEVVCEFCGSHYVLDKIDVEELFRNDAARLKKN